MKNKYLKQAQKNIKGCFSYFKNKDILVVSEDKSIMPFAFLITDEARHPGKILMSLAIDYPFSDKAVNLALQANAIAPVVVSDKFFVSQTGNTYIGEEAAKYYEMESSCPLELLDPSNESLH